jgi:hypothetical protein
METSVAVSDRRFSERSEVKGNMTDIAIKPVDIMASETNNTVCYSDKTFIAFPQTPLTDDRTSISKKI